MRFPGHAPYIPKRKRASSSRTDRVSRPVSLERTMIEIAPYEPRHLMGLLDVANLHLALVPPRDARLTAPALETAVTHYERLWLHHYPLEEGETPISHQSLVATSGGEPVGLITAGWTPDDERGNICFFIAHPSVPGAADRLLCEAEALLAAKGCTSIDGSGRSPIGLGWFDLPTTWTHLIEAYERAGFACYAEWIIMAGRTDAIPVGPPQPRLEKPDIRFVEDAEHCEWHLEIRDGEKLVGECDAWGVPPHLDSCPGFGDWITIEWVGVEEEFQRRGFAFWLMAKQMHYHLRAGRSRAMVWTEKGNLPARALNRRLGLGDGPAIRRFGKSLRSS